MAIAAWLRKTLVGIGIAGAGAGIVGGTNAYNRAEETRIAAQNTATMQTQIQAVNAHRQLTTFEEVDTTIKAIETILKTTKGSSSVRHAQGGTAFGVPDSIEAGLDLEPLPNVLQALRDLQYNYPYALQHIQDIDTSITEINDYNSAQLRLPPVNRFPYEFKFTTASGLYARSLAQSLRTLYAAGYRVPFALSAIETFVVKAQEFTQLMAQSNQISTVGIDKRQIAEEITAQWTKSFKINELLATLAELHRY